VAAGRVGQHDLLLREVKQTVTLIVAVGTPEVVVQVSDRRLTSITLNGIRALHPEEETKSTVWTLPTARFAVGYTGIARLGRKPVEEAL
jgi:hypothetical protein